MLYEIISHDSMFFNKNIFSLTEFPLDKNIFIKEEQNMICLESPYYVQTKLNANDFKKIHFLEERGFNFVEFRLSAIFYLSELSITNSFYPYNIEDVSSNEDLNIIINIAKNNVDDNRFTADPDIKKSNSLLRTLAYLKQSSESKNEILFKFENIQTKEIIGYRTVIIEDENTAVLSLTGLNTDFNRDDNFFQILNHLTLMNLKDRGFIFCKVIISGNNLKEIDFYLKKMEFSLSSNQVILRKIYK